MQDRASSREHGRSRDAEALGNWERVYDTYSGELMGFRMKAHRKDDSDVKSAGHSPAAISWQEMQTNC